MHLLVEHERVQHGHRGRGGQTVALALSREDREVVGGVECEHRDPRAPQPAQHVVQLRGDLRGGAALGAGPFGRDAVDRGGLRGDLDPGIGEPLPFPRHGPSGVHEDHRRRHDPRLLRIPPRGLEVERRALAGGPRRRGADLPASRPVGDGCCGRRGLDGVVAGALCYFGRAVA